MKDNTPDLIVQLQEKITGTTLFSQIFGYVTLEDILTNGDIVVRRTNGKIEIFNKKGQYYIDDRTDDVSPCQLLELA